MAPASQALQVACLGKGRWVRQKIEGYPSIVLLPARMSRLDDQFVSIVAMQRWYKAADARDIADQKRPPRKRRLSAYKMRIEMTESEVRLSLRNTSVVGITEVIQSLALEL